MPQVDLIEVLYKGALAIEQEHLEQHHRRTNPPDLQALEGTGRAQAEDDDLFEVFNSPMLGGSVSSLVEELEKHELEEPISFPLLSPRAVIDYPVLPTTPPMTMGQLPLLAHQEDLLFDFDDVSDH